MKEGRSTNKWVDYDFYGNQIVCHLVGNYRAIDYIGKVDGDKILLPNFGVNLSSE